MAHMLREIVSITNLLLITAEIITGCYLVYRSKCKDMTLLFLGLFMFTLAATFISLAFYYTRLYYDYPHTVQIENFLVISHAPLFYIFISSLLEGNDFVSRKTLLHFLPAVLATLVTIPFYFAPVEEKIQYLNNVYAADHPVRYLLVSSLSFLQYCVYYVISFRKLVKFSHRLSTVKNDTMETKVWVNSLIAYFYLSTALSFFPALIEFNEQTAIYLPIVSCPYFLFVVYTIWRKPYIFKQVAAATEVLDSVDILEKSRKIENMAEKYNELAERMHKEIVTRKLFMDPELSLNRLSDTLGTKAYMITWVLKNHYNESFYTYINSMRVEEAKRLLTHDSVKNYTIDYIGQMVGFNSKSVFYTSFKKITGETPLQFLKRAGTRSESPNFP